MLQNVLYPIRNFAANYVDDMAVGLCSDEWQQHLNHVDEFLNTIKQSGLTLTLKKSEFAKPEVKFCGNILGSGGKRVDPDKLAAIKLLNHPETKSQVRQVLGLFGWFREYIPAFDKGNEQPVMFFSKRLSETQQKWSTIEREAFAVIEMLKCIRAFVFGFRIHLYSDHNALNFLTDSAPKSAKLMW